MFALVDRKLARLAESLLAQLQRAEAAMDSGEDRSAAFIVKIAACVVALRIVTAMLKVNDWVWGLVERPSTDANPKMTDSMNAVYWSPELVGEQFPSLSRRSKTRRGRHLFTVVAVLSSLAIGAIVTGAIVTMWREGNLRAEALQHIARENNLRAAEGLERSTGENNLPAKAPLTDEQQRALMARVVEKVFINSTRRNKDHRLSTDRRILFGEPFAVHIADHPNWPNWLSESGGLGAGL